MFKKLALVLSGFAIVVVILGGAGFAYAQTQFPPNPDTACPGCESGEGYVGRGTGMMRGGRGGMKGYAVDDKHGPMHEAMSAAFAEAFGLSAEEIKARHIAGETMWQIAEAQGYSLETFRALMLTARSTALAQAVVDGLMTQEQVDWMLSRWDAMQAAGSGPGTGNCTGDGPHGGMMSSGRWSGNQ